MLIVFFDYLILQYQKEISQLQAFEALSHIFKISPA